MIDLDIYSDEARLNIAAFYPKTSCLGPGNRAVLWLQGCLKRCQGCITPEMQPIIEREWIMIKELSEIIAAIEGIEGVTLVGGEPMLQYKALYNLFKQLKKSDKSIMVYTGYSYEELLKYPDDKVKTILSLIDILVDGEYEIENDHNEMWRGSANQRIHFLSDRYKNYQWVTNVRKRVISLHYNDEGRYILIGIPPKDFLNQINTVVYNDGI